MLQDEYRVSIPSYHHLICSDCLRVRTASRSEYDWNREMESREKKKGNGEYMRRLRFLNKSKNYVQGIKNLLFLTA
jgi:hypothetical protein